MRLLDLAVLNLESISLASHTTENGVRIKPKVQSFGKLSSRVTEETNLGNVSTQKQRRHARGKIHSLTPVCLAGSSCSLQAFILRDEVSIGARNGTDKNNLSQETHTKGSLTDTTKTWPASLSLGWFMYEGTCLLEHVPEKAAGTPTM